MKKALYSRKGNIIRNYAAGTHKKYEFINQAKRESRKLQEANGGLGRGSVVVLR